MNTNKEEMNRYIKQLEELLVERTSRLNREEQRRRSAENALLELIEMYQGVYDNISNGIAIYRAVENGENFIFVDYNKAAEKMDQINKAVLIRKKVTDVFPGVEEMGLLKVIKRVYRTGFPERLDKKKYEDERISGIRNNFVYKLSTGEVVVVYEEAEEET
ncbi:MAG: hypothetical protein A2Y40_01490 [Candidatus Margulisbacteria bacterium GWF2_35_9]|nr:MAG: hypothetical protein A2Y40_01490 [Candidatus Margulisbacteria bacterium GWF2_35_9]